MKKHVLPYGKKRIGIEDLWKEIGIEKNANGRSLERIKREWASREDW